MTELGIKGLIELFISPNECGTTSVLWYTRSTESKTLKKKNKNQAISSNRKGKKQGQSKSYTKKKPVIREGNPFPLSAEKCSNTWRSNDSVDASKLKWKWYKCGSRRNGCKQQGTKASPVFIRPYLARRGWSGPFWVWARLASLIRTLSLSDSGIFIMYIIFICFAIYLIALTFEMNSR